MASYLDPEIYADGIISSSNTFIIPPPKKLRVVGNSGLMCAVHLPYTVYSGLYSGQLPYEP